MSLFHSFTLFISSLFLYLSISLSLHLTLHLSFSLSLPLLFHLSSETFSLFLVVDECLANMGVVLESVSVLFCPSCHFKCISTEQPFVLKLFHVSCYKKIAPLKWKFRVHLNCCCLFSVSSPLFCSFFVLCVCVCSVLWVSFFRLLSVCVILWK